MQFVFKSPIFKIFFRCFMTEAYSPQPTTKKAVTFSRAPCFEIPLKQLNKFSFFVPERAYNDVHVNAHKV